MYASKDPFSVAHARSSAPAQPTSLQLAQRPQPKVEPARKSYDRVKVTPQHRGSLRGPVAPNRVKTTHHQPQPTVADQEWQNIQHAIGEKTLKQASNPSVAALQTVLGSATGIPALEHAVRTKNAPVAAAEAASFLPLGRLGRAVKAALDIGKTIEKGEHAAEAARAVKPVVAPATEAAREAPKRITREMTEAEAQKRLANLDKQHEAMVAKFSEAVNPYTKEQAAAETRTRNTMRGRMAQGKKPATGKKAPESTSGFTSKKIPTVKQELSGLAEKKIAELIAAHPEHPAVKQAAKLIDERQQLRDALNARAEHAFGGGEGPPPSLPTIEVTAPGPGSVPASERPGHLPGWTPQGQLFPRAPSPGRYPPTFRTEPLVPRTAEETPHVPGSPLSPQGEVLPRPPMSQAEARKANPLPRETPQIPTGRATERTGGQLGQQIRESMRQAKQLRVEQEQGYSQVRGDRFRSFEQKLRENPTVEGYHAALRELEGELPKLNFADHPQLDQEGLDALVKHIVYHPTLMSGEKARTIRALERVTAGTVPTTSEIRLLEQVFGREVAHNLVASVSTWQKLKWGTLDALNVPRSLMASFDVSAPFRQGLVMAVTHPVIFSKNLGPMMHALVSEHAYQGILEEIHARPTYPLMEGRVAFTELGRTLSKREEAFASNLAEKIPGIGRIVHGSGRAYTGFLDKVRADAFDYLLDQAVKGGREATDERLLEGIARFVNAATGRGSLGPLAGHAVTLNTMLFSPRLLASRLELLLSPITYARADPFARRQALTALRNLTATTAFILYMADLGGAKVGWRDPRSADWAKIRVGNTRVDVLGGFQQPIRFLVQQGLQSTVSSTTGKVIHFGSEGPGKVSAWDVGLRFLRSKAAPVPSLAADLATRQTFAGQPLTPQGAVLSRVTPLAAQDAVDLGRHTGNIPAALGAYGLGAIGFGVQTYGKRKPKGGGTDPFGVGAGAAPNPFGVP